MVSFGGRGKQIGKHIWLSMMIDTYTKKHEIVSQQQSKLNNNIKSILKECFMNATSTNYHLLQSFVTPPVNVVNNTMHQLTVATVRPW